MFARIFICLALVLGGGAGSYFFLVRPGLQVIDARSWTPTDCQITRSQVTRYDDHSHRTSSERREPTYSLEIAYRYVVEGREYESSRYSLLEGFSSSGRGTKDRIVQKYPSGRIVTCYVNPLAPGEAVLNRGFTAEMLLGLVPLLFVALGLMGMGLVPASLGPALAGWAQRTIEARRRGSRFVPQWQAEPKTAPAKPPRHRHVEYGLAAAVALTGLAAFRLIASIGDEVSDTSALVIHLFLVAALAFGYYRRSVAAAMALLVYLVCLVLVALAVPPWMEMLRVRLLHAAPTALVIPLVELPGLGVPIHRYARETVPLAGGGVVLAMIGLFLGTRRLIAERDRNLRPVLAGAMALPALLLVLIVGSAVAAFRGEPVVEPRTPEQLAAALTGTADADRQAACRQVQSLAAVPPGLVPALVSAASATQDDVTLGTCLSALRQSGPAGQEAIPLLTAGLQSPSSYVRLVSAGTLAEIAVNLDGAARAAAVEAILPLAADPDTQTRRAVVGALQRLGADSPAALALFARAADDPEVDVHHTALRALSAAGPAAAEAIPAVIRATRHANEFTRVMALEALAVIGPQSEAARQALAAALEDPEASVREAAVKAMTKVAGDGDDFVPTLAACLKDTDMRVRGAAILGLTERGPRAAPAVPGLIEILSGREIYLRVWAVEALGAIGPAAKPALPRLRQMLTEKLVTNESEALQIPTVVPAAIAKIEG